MALNPLDAHALINSLGVVGVGAVLFAETGLLVGFFLPGDSLLFTAGLLASTATPAHLRLPLAALLVVSAVGAVAGAQTGYQIGRRTGPLLLARSSRVREGTERASEFLARYGHPKALVLARFVPVVRTVMNPLAGVVGVPARVFATWQVLGGIGWTTGVTLLGFALGGHVKNIDHYLLPVVAVVVLASLTPFGVELLRASRSRRPRAT